ncbi:MAG: SpvB/TcaC N-terminal domain-containing protein, partial [Gammaproteobacteria bacterium]
MTPTGQAVYTMPLPAPGGAGGLAPQLSFVYASGSGPGLLGWDITVGGLSAINRCSPTWPYDGATGPPTLTNGDYGDRFCIDGMELSATSGTYGSDGTEYAATPNAHLKIFSHTTTNSFGSQWFEVKRPDGSTWEYGHQFNSAVEAVNATGSSVDRVWTLDQIEDASGNVVTFHYTQPGGMGTLYLSEVDWGGNVNVGTSADHSLVFSYDTVGADATFYRYLVDNEIIQNQRLSQIVLKYNGATTMIWTPSYLPDDQGSDHSRLASLTECAGSDCLPATIFQWQQGTPGYAAAQNTGQAGPANADTFVADVNGDGLDDLIYSRANVWRVRFGMASGGFGGEYSTGVSSSLDPDWGQPIHYQSGAADQILVAKSYSGTARWAVIAWTGSSFTVTNTGIAAASPAAAADVDGDGYDDLVTYDAHTVYVRLSTARNASPGFGTAQTAYTFDTTDTIIGFRGVGQAGARGPSRGLHFGLTEAGVIVRVHHYEEFCESGPCHTFENWYDDALTWSRATLELELYEKFALTLSSANADKGEVVPLDVNGDGQTDLVLSGSANLMLNTGTGLSLVGYGSSTAGLSLDESVAVDYGGNGRDDLLVPGTSGDWMLLASTGTGLDAPVDTGVAAGAFGAAPVVADSEGRMLDDLVGVNGSGNIELALRQGAYPDLVAQITDGLGNYHSLDWAPLSDTSAVQATLSVPDGFERTRRGFYLIASDEHNDGAGGSYTMSRSYDTPLLRLGVDETVRHLVDWKFVDTTVLQAGVGFTGIRRITTTDSRSNDTVTNDYGFAQFENGVLTSSTLAQASGKKIRSDQYQYNGLTQGGTLTSNNRTTTYYDQSVQNDQALYTVSRDYGYDGNAVVNDITVTTTDASNGDTWVQETVLDNAAGFPNGGGSCYGLVKSATVTNTLPGGASATRKTSYLVSILKCRYTGFTRNADQATALQTTTALTYGNFGNVIQASVTGHDAGGSALPVRTTQYGYDPQGEFQTSMTDPLGEVTGYVWDAARGLKTSQTMPNGTTTSYAYDGFGRLTQTTFPSGAYQTINRQACTGNDCNSWAYLAQVTLYDAHGGQAEVREQKYDKFNRLVTSGRQLESLVAPVGGTTAKWSWSERSYDARGRIAETSAPHYDGDPTLSTTYTYGDPLGRVTEVQAPTAGGGTASTTYSYPGFLTKITDPKGNLTTITTNPLGQTVSVVDSAGTTTSYAYTPFAQISSVNTPAGETTVDYDGAGNRTGIAPPDLGSVTFLTDSFGEVTQKINAAAEETDYSYDKLGRMTAENFPGDTSENNTWSYAASGNAAGQLTDETKANGYSRSLAYNALGEPITDTETYGGSAWSMSYAYDTLGRVQTLTYPQTAAAQTLRLSYLYDDLGNLTGVKNVHSGTMYWASGGAIQAWMNAWGGVTRWTLGDGVGVERAQDPGTGAITSVT